jgi:uncharacterized protein (DUF1697 family)
MDALQRLYIDQKFEKVQTYIQSGNVVFQFMNAETKEIEKTIAKAISERFGFDVPVIVKELDEVKQIARNNPFLSDNSKDISYLHVTFLSDTPSPENSLKIMDDRYGEDEFKLIDNVVYLYCPTGYSNSKLTNGFFENKLKAIATTRNWKTTSELINIAERLSKL